jgi:hypothetical protein
MAPARLTPTFERNLKRAVTLEPCSDREKHGDEQCTADGCSSRLR